jgi:hypothetical protein
MDASAMVKSCKFVTVMERAIKKIKTNQHVQLGHSLIAGFAVLKQLK